MSDEKILLFNDIYNQTQHFGRTQFVREIMKLQQENSRLKEELEELKHKHYLIQGGRGSCKTYLLHLQKENQELKEQLEEYKRLGFKHLNDKCNKLENQQKEFIEYMNKTIEELETDDVGDEELKGYLIQEIDIFKEILSKYKKIIEK